MKNILYYFYLLCFLVLIGFGLASLIENEDYIFSAILMQLIWGPISVLHCLFKVVQYSGLKTKIAQLYRSSMLLTIVYFVCLFIVSNFPDLFGFVSEDTLTLVALGAIPWAMLAFFTFILHLEKNLIPLNFNNIEEDLID